MKVIIYSRNKDNLVVAFGASLDAGDEIDVIYLDFSKAFDSVPHGKLLHKLTLFGIQGPLHAWFTDYLNSRSQRVVIDGTLSNYLFGKRRTAL